MGQHLSKHFRAAAALCAALCAASAAAQDGAAAAANRIAMAGGTCARQQWPREALRYEIEGKVRIGYRVTPEGDVNEARVTKSSGWALLDAASVAAAKTCRFTPEQAAAVQDRELPVEFVWTLGEDRAYPRLVPGSCVPSGAIGDFQPFDNGPTNATGAKVRFLINGNGQPYDVKLEGNPDAALADQVARHLETCRFAFDPDAVGMRSHTLTGRVSLR
jgi:TonB family protein